MKKIAFFAVALAAVMMVSCGKKSSASSEAVFEEKTMEDDSLAYIFGRLQGDGFRTYVMQMGQPLQFDCKIDSIYMNDFIRGLNSGTTANLDSAELAYAKGYLLAQLINNMSEGLSREVFADDSTKMLRAENIFAGFIESLQPTNEKPEEHQKAMEAFNQRFNARMQAVQDAKMEKEFGDYKKQNEAYLKENGKKEGVTTLKSGVQYKVLTAGDGALPTDSTTVKVLYEGKTIDGNVFDSSEKHNNEPFEISMKNPSVIPGWVEVLKLMPAGSKWEVTIPQDQAYGSRQPSPDIKPFSTLVFTIEVLK